MKKIALFTGALCAMSSAAALAQQSVVMIPAFQNRFASIHEPVVALNTINRAPALEVRTFGGVSSTTDPAVRGVVTSPTAAAPRRGALDPTTMNIPVFPGNTVFAQGALAPGQLPFTTFPQGVGMGGNQGGFIQQSGGRTMVEVDPFRTTATPGPAVNAVPDPAAPVPTIPQLQPPTGTTILVPQQNPPVLQQVVPGTPIPGTPGQIQPQAQPNTPSQPSSAVPNSPAPTPSTPQPRQ